LNEVQHHRLFIALTRPQMFAGVTYSFFIANVIVAMELFLITRTFWPLLIGAAVHVLGYLACLREPRMFDLYLLRFGRCPRVRNHGIWQCNSYRP
jgi:type IV secretion system protein VirB3